MNRSKEKIATLTEKAVEKINVSVNPVLEEYHNLKREVSDEINMSSHIICKTEKRKLEYNKLYIRFENKCNKIVNKICTDLELNRVHVLLVMGIRTNAGETILELNN